MGVPIAVDPTGSGSHAIRAPWPGSADGLTYNCRRSHAGSGTADKRDNRPSRLIHHPETLTTLRAFTRQA
jgi:hypothetical protein